MWKGKYSAFPGELVAIKVFFVTPDSDVSRGAFGDREVALLAKTPPHKNIVFVIGAGQSKINSQIFLVSEFMSGGDLRTLLDHWNTDLPWARRLQIAKDIAEGMTFLHTRGMIHRDLKSLNILLDGITGRAKIADFGLSKVTGSHHAILRQCTSKNKQKSKSTFSMLSGMNSAHSTNGNDSSNRSGRANATHDPTTPKKIMLKMAQDMERELCRPKISPWYHGEKREVAFKGSDAVNWLVTSARASDPRQAMALGTKLLQAGYFALKETSGNTCSRTYDKMLDDKRMFYIFNLDRLSNGTDSGGSGGSDGNGRNDGNGGYGGSGNGTDSGRSTSGSSYTPPSVLVSTNGPNNNASTDSGTLSQSNDSGSTSGEGGGSSSSPYQTFLTGKVGSLLWMAPEIMNQDGRTAAYGLESDVFSFGVVLYELLTRRYPWDNIQGPLWQTVSSLVIDGHRPLLNTNEETTAMQDPTGKMLTLLMHKCWDHNPQNRPTFDFIACSLLVKETGTREGEKTIE